MPDLLQTYPQYEDKIERSRKAGYSDEEIASFISNYEQKKPSFTGALLKRAKPEMTLSAQKKAKSLAEKEFWSKLVPAEALFKGLGTASTALWSQVGSAFKDKTAGELVQEDTHLGDVAKPQLPIKVRGLTITPELQKFALDMIGDPAVWLGGFTGPGLITGLAKKAGKKGLKKVVEKIPKWEIPKLSSTNDAIKEGLKVKGNKKAIETLRKKEQELIGLFKEETNIEKKAQLSFQKQFHREAREAATGEGGIGKALKEKESPLKKTIEQAKKESKGLRDVVKDAKARGQRLYPETKVDPVTKVKDALDKLPRLLIRQKALYSKGRSERAGGLVAIGEKYGGEAGSIKKLQYLSSKGALETVDFKSIRKVLTQDETDELFNVIGKSDLLPFEKITAERGLRKILGAEGGKIPQPSELEELRKVFPEDFIKSVMDKTPLLAKLWKGTLNALNLPRAMMATADLSAPLRQGVFMIGRPKQFFPAFKEMFKYAFNEKAYTGYMRQVKHMPTYKLMKEGKLALTEMGTDLLKREEPFMSNLAEKIPGFGRIAKGSNRAYSGFLNKLRVDVFNDLIKRKGVKLDNTKIKQIASYVNSATGRGDLGKHLSKIAPLLNATAFSPRLVASRLQLVGKVFNPNTSRFVRKELLKDWVKFLGVGTTVLSLAKLNGAKVGLDPRSADFGKIKFGDTRYDIWGGFQQYAVLLYRLLSGTTVSSTTGREYKLGEEGYKPTTRADILGRGLEFKLSPTTSFAWSAFRGRTAIGKEFKIAPEIMDRMIPMVTQDIYDLARDEGVLGVGMAAPAIFGVGVQKYGERIPVRDKTPMGKPNIKWSFEPTLGEVLVNKVTGKKITNIPKWKQKQLREERERKIQYRIKLDKAKKIVLETGEPQQVDGTFIYLQNGVVKTKGRYYPGGQ